MNPNLDFRTRSVVFLGNLLEIAPDEEFPDETNYLGIAASIFTALCLIGLVAL